MSGMLERGGAVTVSNKKTRAKRLLIHQLKSSLGALLISVMTISSVIYYFSEQILMDTVQQSMLYHANFRESRIHSLLKNEKQWMEKSAEDSDFRQRVEWLKSLFNINEDSVRYQFARDQFRKEHELLLKQQEVEDLLLITEEGKLFFSLRPMEEEMGIDLTIDGFYGKTILSDLIEEVVEKKRLVLSRFGRVEQIEDSTVMVGIPLISNFVGTEGEMIAILVKPLAIERIRELLESHDGLGESGEVVIGQLRGEVIEDGVNFINHFRDAENRQPDADCQLLRSVSPEQFAMISAISTVNGSGWRLDNSCREVYSIWKWLPELGWGMVVKQDREEILAPVGELQRKLLVAALLVLLFLIWVVQRQVRSVVLPIEKLTKAAEQGEIASHQPGNVEEVNHLAVALQKSTAELTRTNRETDQVLESLDEGLLVVDANGVVIRTNPKMGKLVGSESADLVGMTLHQLLESEKDLRCIDGTLIPVTLSRSEIEGLEGDDAEQGDEVLIVHDMRQVLLAENAIRANSSKDEFLASMSHELRTPLTSIIGYSELLSNKLRDPELRALNRTIEYAGRSQLALVNDILDLSKMEAGKFMIESHPYDLHNLLVQLGKMFTIQAQDKGIDFRIEEQATFTHQLLGDEMRVRQIITNLLSNALKFTAQGSVHLLLSTTEDQLQIAVTDSGIGISPESLQKLFQRFQQVDSSISRKFGGTGLGLYISHNLAMKMGGVIEVESEEGNGSTFRLILPLVESGLPCMEVDESWEDTEQMIEQYQGTVLVAEDTPDIQQYLYKQLKSYGCSVTLAENGQVAMDYALSQHFDLVLMDMQMPVMDGIEATQILRSLGSEYPIVALTANVMQVHRDKFNEAGANDFLTKPIDSQAMRQILKKYLTVKQVNSSEIDGYVHEESVIDDEMMQVFVETLQQHREKLDRAFKEQQWKQVRQTAHAIKGSGATFGYPPLTTWGKEVCDLIDHEALDDVQASVVRLQKEIVLVIAEFSPEEEAA